MNQDGKADVWTTPPSSPAQFTTPSKAMFIVLQVLEGGSLNRLKRIP